MFKVKGSWFKVCQQESKIQGIGLEAMSSNKIRRHHYFLSKLLCCRSESLVVNSQLNWKQLAIRKEYRLKKLDHLI